MSSQGKFIVIEGIDGAGTSTQASLLSGWFEGRGVKAAATCEPSRGPVGNLLRQILNGRLVARSPNGESRTMNDDVIALLFAADRMDHLDCEVLPLLEAGIHVISDRYVCSSILYQSLRGDLEWIRSLNAHAISPDVTYVLDLPFEQAADRRRRQRSHEELFEQDSLQAQLAEQYRRLPEVMPSECFVMIDASRDIRHVHQAIFNDLLTRFDWS